MGDFSLVRIRAHGVVAACCVTDDSYGVFIATRTCFSRKYHFIVGLFLHVRLSTYLGIPVAGAWFSSLGCDYVWLSWSRCVRRLLHVTRGQK